VKKTPFSAYVVQFSPMMGFIMYISTFNTKILQQFREQFQTNLKIFKTNGGFEKDP